MPPVSSSASVARRATQDREEAQLTLASQRLREQWLCEARAAAFLGCIHSVRTTKPLLQWARLRTAHQPQPAADQPQLAAVVIEISDEE